MYVILLLQYTPYYCIYTIGLVNPLCGKKTRKDGLTFRGVIDATEKLFAMLLKPQKYTWISGVNVKFTWISSVNDKAEIL
jgi:hypothetical protein